MKKRNVLVTIDYEESDEYKEIHSSSVFCNDCGEAINTLIDLKDKYFYSKIKSERINVQVGEVGEIFADLSLYNIHNLTIIQQIKLIDIIKNAQNQLLEELKKIE